jgi:hypothetical protein
MKNIKITPQYAATIPLGRRGENNARQIIFDCSGFEREYPGGTPQLLVQRHWDDVPYLPPIVRDGDTVLWTLTAADTAKSGTGRAELRWYVGDTLAKSRIWDTYNMTALGEPSEDVPEPDKSAVELLIEEAGTAVRRAGAEADRAENQADRAENQADRAENQADRAENQADRAEQAAAQAGYLDFEIDQRGHLIYNRTDNVSADFSIEEGRLIYHGN